MGAVVEAAEAAILKLWLESGSDTVDLLMERTLKAMDEKNYSLALDFLDRIVTLEPDYVEGWNKRATVFYLTDDYGKSVSDIERVLSIEPRHFGALAGLGTILRELGDDKRALEAYRQALALDPAGQQGRGFVCRPVREQVGGERNQIGELIQARLGQRQNPEPGLLGQSPIFQAAEQFGLGQGAQMATVKGLQFLNIENRPTQADALDVKRYRQVGEREMLPAILKTVGQQAQVIDQCFRQDAGALIIEDADRVLALG